jgi:adenylosuccinate synthase
LTDTSQFLDEAIQGGANVLAEGAQGTLLDLDHGTYPFVTSSWPTSAGALIGLGIGPKHVRRVIGVAKAFTSRVGSGPFPSELSGEAAKRLRGSGDKPWDEFGTTTGRPRRVGWLDLVILKYAVRVNGLTELALTKLDILSNIPKIPVCVAYECHDRVVDSFPADLKLLGDCKPVLDYLPGWKGDISSIRTRNDLPANAVKYVDFIQDFLGIPVCLISVGPERDQIIIC